MKSNIIYAFLFFSTFVFSQGQFGFSGGLSINNFKSNDLIDVVSRSSLSLGLNNAYFATKSSDILSEIGYSRGSMVVGGYKDFEGDRILFDDNKITINTFYVQALYNQYLIIPDTQTFHASLQGGLGLDISGWEMESETFFNDRGSVSPFYTLGISGGTEQLRVAIRYNNLLGNQLKDIFVNGIPDDNNRSDRRELDASASSITIKLTYFWAPFYN